MIFLIAVGNTMRRDDGVAHRVLELLEPSSGVLTRSCHQLTPELAEDIATAETVIIIDADVEPGEPRVEVIEEQPSDPVTHMVRPSELVTLSRTLYSFSGKAYLCRVPGFDFEQGIGLSAEAESNARRAAGLVRSFVA